MKNFTLTGTKLLVKEKKEIETKNGIIIPESADDDEGKMYFEIVKLGEDMQDERTQVGKTVAMLPQVAKRQPDLEDLNGYEDELKFIDESHIIAYKND